MTHPIRAAADEVMAGFPDTFLKRDRGARLYVTDAPKTGRGAECERALERAGFCARRIGALIYVMPGDSLTDSFTEWAEPACAGDPLFEDFARFNASESCEDERGLFAEGLKLLETQGVDNDKIMIYERRVRQMAARCLRDRQYGGRLRACAAIHRILFDRSPVNTYNTPKS
jgi:hypothetical protein